MPRRPNNEMRTEWKISLPATLAGQIEMLLLDPITGKPRYGARRQLIEGLLTEWLAAQLDQPLDQPSGFKPPAITEESY